MFWFLFCSLPYSHKFSPFWVMFPFWNHDSLSAIIKGGTVCDVNCSCDAAAPSDLCPRLHTYLWLCSWSKLKPYSVKECCFLTEKRKTGISENRSKNTNIVIKELWSCFHILVMFETHTSQYLISTPKVFILGFLPLLYFRSTCFPNGCCWFPFI